MIESLGVVGATGAVGCIIRQLLEARDFPLRHVKFLASARSAGMPLEFRGEKHVVERLCPESFDDLDLCIASTPDDVAKEFVPWAVARGTIVVDESGAWRMDPRVPLVVPEVNPDALATHQGIIASPNCSTTQMVVAIKPLHDAARVRRVIVSTYQATSGAGVGGQRELLNGTAAHLANRPYQHQTFQHSIAFNLIPQIGSAKYEGYTSEEMKMVWETHKILGDETIQICPTCVRVPVENCHSESILVETEKPLSVAEARQLFADADGIQVIDDLGASEYPMPFTCSGKDEVFVGRIRRDLSSPNGLTFWCVSDNLRKGAATNAVQIAERLLASQLVRERVMRWLKLTLAYDGTDFCGWQIQAEGRSIQGTLEQAWQRVSGEAVRVVASGRTDAGVHALAQVVSLSTMSTLSGETIARALNATLPSDIRIRDVAEVPAGFHAIRDCRGKRYRYLIQDGGVRDVFSRRYAWFVPYPLDQVRMRDAAQLLVGRHDFAAFQASGSPRKSTVRHVRQLTLERHPNEAAPMLRLEVEADGFLYNMVRNIVGSLVDVGRGKYSPSWVAEVLASRQRGQDGATAPAHGLCLTWVQYDVTIGGNSSIG